MIASMRDRVIKGYKYKIFYTSAIWLCLRFVQEFRTRHCPRVIVRKIAGWRYPVLKRAALSWFYNGINIIVNGCKNWPIAIKCEEINWLWLDNSYNYNHLRLRYCRIIFTLCLFEISHFEFLRRETIDLRWQFDLRSCINDLLTFVWLLIVDVKLKARTCSNSITSFIKNLKKKLIKEIKFFYFEK